MSTDDPLQDLVRTMAEAVFNEPAESQTPMATVDAEEVIKRQLTTNTGTHFLDSGGAYGRHWEENQENPPWEDAEYQVGRGYVTRNVYHFMRDRFGRDRRCVDLEMALYAFAHTDDRKRDAWLRCMEPFADAILAGDFTQPSLSALGLPPEVVEGVMGFQADVQPERHRHRPNRRSEPNGAFTANTYNGEFGANTQILQGTNFGGPYAEYVMIQVHQGADVRGGYTAPRVYKTFDGWIPGEFFFRCHNCGWEDAESCVYGSDDLLYQRSVDPFELEDEGLLDEGDEEHPALQQAYSAEEDGHMSGAIFHRCDHGDFGYVGVM